MKITFIIFSLMAGFHAMGGDRLLLETREAITKSLGPPVERVEAAQAVFLGMDVQRLQKSDWNFIVYFAEDRSRRIRISRIDNASISDTEIAEVLAANKSYNAWSEWKQARGRVLNARAWGSGGKIHFYALVSNAGKALELITDGYIEDLGFHTWLESANPPDDKSR
jgi:hypothetical protein